MPLHTRSLAVLLDADRWTIRAYLEGEPATCVVTAVLDDGSVEVVTEDEHRHTLTVSAAAVLEIDLDPR